MCTQLNGRVQTCQLSAAPCHLLVSRQYIGRNETQRSVTFIAVQICFSFVIMVDCDVNLLITLVSSRPIIWDKSLDRYKSRAESTAAWIEVLKELNKDVDNMGDDEKNTYGAYYIT
ncbi:hypothetical protein PR048_014583 [Dryococelus australis]|uniref:MADF domain-containing protein n=1 Tax=Dryococelus australis TaxID=614101 RepID=A0ABQ9HET0_9NEOP|nr:hypothetical protein PR048_014583 [Dryococelus australis]